MTFPTPIMATGTRLTTTAPVQVEIDGAVVAGVDQLFAVDLTQGNNELFMYVTAGFNNGAGNYAIKTPVLPGFPTGAGFGPGNINVFKEAVGSNLPGGALRTSPIDGLTLFYSTFSLVIP